MSSRTRLATLASLSALALAGLSGCGDEAKDPASADSTPTQAADPSDDASEPTEPTSSAAAETTTVPVYFVGDTPQGQRLFREFRKVEADNPADEALALMTAGDALDPDYDTLYPDGGSFSSVDVGDKMITVDMSDDSWTTAPDGMSEDDARLAAQQLVYTVQGVAQKRLPVSITVDGAPADLFGLAGQVTNDPEIDVRALVNVTTPEEGASVRGTFTATGVSSSFEATTPWEIRAGGADGKVVTKGFATAEGWMDKLYPWETEVDVSGLPAGDYTFVAMTDDPSGGEGGGPTVDTKSITVK
ncbi:Gmad2 immunoglobulin-like domain-containing protein [Nocardioides sp. URHA0020]|uniref:Gmad2 immunoglobulin-like domain-containing protein n=1 Tax=Nocardioides sp. URHA0020 TaxID=1380392 RepID=UPI00055A9AA2|nr:Gmad2 immunoglobulin-like domain-containing protein [Nocardioides sp. URHA0020]